MFDVDDLNKYCETKFPKLKIKKYNENFLLVTGPANSGKTSFILDLYKRIQNHDDMEIMQSIIDVESLIQPEIAEKMISEINLDEDDIFRIYAFDDIMETISGFNRAYKANIIYIDSLDRIQMPLDFANPIYDINMIDEISGMLKKYSGELIIVATLGVHY